MMVSSLSILFKWFNMAVYQLFELVLYKIRKRVLEFLSEDHSLFMNKSNFENVFKNPGSSKSQVDLLI